MAERSPRKSKPKTKAKAKKKAAAETNGATAPIGHNSGVDVPDEVYQRHILSLQTKRTAMDKANDVYKKRKGEYGSACRLAEDDGVQVDSIHLARNLDKQDRIEVARLYQNTGRVLRLMDSPLATQLDMFTDVTVPPPENPVIAGEAAGKRGDDRDINPHVPGSEAYVLFDNAWMRGQSAIAQEMGRA